MEIWMRTSVRRLLNISICVLRLVVIALLFPTHGKAQSATPAEALALEQQGKLEEAAQAWRSVTKRNPQDAAAFASLGVVLAKQQKYADAAVSYKRALSLNPKLPGIHLNLGIAEFKQGNFAAAIEPLRAAVAAQNASSVQARLLLGLSYYGSKQFAEASNDLELSAKSDLDNAELHKLLAHSCLWAKKYSCAFEQFQWIEQKEPGSAASHMLIGEALDGLGRTPEAVVEFQTAVSSAPREPGVNFGLGYLYWKQHQYDDAKSAFETELSVDPANPQALAYLGDIEMKKSDPEKAISLFEKALQLKDDIRIAYADLGAIYTEQRHYQDALAALQRAVNLDPAQPDTHFRLGRLYQAMRNTAAANKEFAKVRELHKKSEDDLSEKMSGSPPPLPPQ
jgi:tetratricopeptide (TPR) repeat protein